MGSSLDEFSEIAHGIMRESVECGELSDQDFEALTVASPSIQRLAAQGHIEGVLRLPQMLDVSLSGQLSEDLQIAGEADVVEWWWRAQVRGNVAIAAEERVTQNLSSRMADELVCELPPTAVAQDEPAVANLIRNRVL